MPCALLWAKPKGNIPCVPSRMPCAVGCRRAGSSENGTNEAIWKPSFGATHLVRHWDSCPGSRGVTIPGGAQNCGDVAPGDVDTGIVEEGLGSWEVFSSLRDSKGKSSAFSSTPGTAMENTVKLDSHTPVFRQSIFWHITAFLGEIRCSLK